MRAVLAFVIVAVTLGGASAAPVSEPVARYAPKGMPGQPTREQPFAGTEYLYVATLQNIAPRTPGVAGAGAMILQAEPALGIGDAHSLAEIAVQSDDQKQIVEIGWTVDPGVNHDLQPHVFAFHWVDGQPSCYNGCGWVQVSPHKQPGMRVTPGESHRYEIKLVNNDWWLFYDGEGMGYYPQSLWGGRFKVAGLTQWFGEVAAGVTSPCTHMGNGKLGADPAATSFDELRLFDAQGVSVAAGAEPGTVTNPALYNVGRRTPTSFAFGGPGAAAGCCTPSTCLAAGAQCGSIPDSVCAGNTLACGMCSGTDVCTADHTCPSGVGPRDDGDAYDVPADRGSGGCCDAGGGGPGALVLGALVALGVLVPARRGARA
jgi:uncharacterized protein (TIGR03382 family)